MAVKLERFSSNPLLTPTSNWWECAAVFNCGAVEYNGKIYLLYRAVGQDRASRFGLAISRDGVTIDERRPQPVFETDYNNPNEWCGCEDPRITPLDGQYYIAYTAVSLYPSNTIKYSNETPWRTRVALLQTSDFETFSRRGIIFSDEVDDKDAALFPAKIDGRYFIFHRRNLAIVLASSSDLIQWKEEGTILK
ncbi:MAG: glycosidase, partial [Patescibacteria group bacterium]